MNVVKQRYETRKLYNKKYQLHKFTDTKYRSKEKGDVQNTAVKQT